MYYVDKILDMILKKDFLSSAFLSSFIVKLVTAKKVALKAIIADCH